MKQVVLLLLPLLIAFAARTSAYKFSPQVAHSLDYLEKIWASAHKFRSSSNIGDFSFECAVCGIALNEVEGMLIENRTDTEIEDFLKNELCVHLSGTLGSICDLLTRLVPSIIQMGENRWSVSTVCVDLGICKAPFANHSESMDVPAYTVDLNKPPAQRWASICSNSSFQYLWQHLVSTIQQVLPDQGVYLRDLGRDINFFLPAEYSDEIKGCAQALGVDYGFVTLLNIGYEVSDACTSIIAQANDGTIMHARNLDFWAGMGFTDTLKGLTMHVTFTRDNNPVFQAHTFAGFIGILSGMRPENFSITVNTRFYPDGIKELFYEIIAALEEKNATLVGLLSREALTDHDNWDDAVELLSNGELVCDVYYICAGVRPTEGVVITRNRLNASDVWRLNPPDTWFILETNYDHWKPAPWFDDRRDPGNHYMEEMGRDQLSLDGLWKVLSTKPVLNLQTTYSMLSVPANSTYFAKTRWCPYPCVQ